MLFIRKIISKQILARRLHAMVQLETERAKGPSLQPLDTQRRINRDSGGRMIMCLSTLLGHLDHK